MSSDACQLMTPAVHFHEADVQGVPSGVFMPKRETYCPSALRVSRPTDSGQFWYVEATYSGFAGGNVIKLPEPADGRAMDCIRTPASLNSSRYMATLPVPSGAAPSPMRDTTTLYGENGTGGIHEVVGVIEGVTDMVAENEGDIELVGVGGTDGDVEGDCNGSRVTEGVVDAVGVFVGVAVCDGVGVPVGMIGARATPRKAVLGAAVASGEPPFTHVRLDGENAYSAAAVTA